MILVEVISMYLDAKAKIIADYIKDSRYTQAVLVNGAWGVGKTFFVENILLEELKDYTVVRYSLYGVHSSEQVMSELQREMLIKIVENKEINLRGKNLKIPSKLLDIVPNGIGMLLKKVGFEPDDLNEIISKIDFDKSEIIIIFDDLERSEMEINEILGVINFYVECQKIKVIIIANENEIGSSRVSSNLPEKFSVASSPSISLEEITSNGDKNTNIAYSYDELIKRTKILFSNDIIYNSIKEKLIGLTVTINADFHELYDQIISKYAEKSKGFLFQNKDIVIEQLQDLECQNLRTLIFAIISFDKLYNVIIALKDIHTTPQYIKKLNEELTSILKSVIVTSLLYKSGKTFYSADNSSSSSWYFFKRVKEYSFVNKFIYFHELNESGVKEEMDSYIQDKLSQQEEKKLSYHKFNSFGWLDYSDDEVIKLSDQLYDELSEEKYDVKYFKEILIYLIQLEYHFKEKKGRLKHIDSEYITLMEQYIHNHELKERQLEMFDTFSENDDFIEKFNSYATPLKTATIEKENISANNEIKNIFESDNWAEKFYQHCRSNHNNFLSSNGFLSFFDVNTIIKSLSKANNQEIRRFSQAICAVYDFNNIRDFFHTDIANLERIINALDERYTDDNTDCTTKVVIRTYIEKLKSNLELLK